MADMRLDATNARRPPLGSPSTRRTANSCYACTRRSPNTRRRPSIEWQCCNVCHGRAVADPGEYSGVSKQGPSLDDLCKGREFEGEIIIHRVRWYLQHKLSYRDLVAMMAKRGVSLAPSTILLGAALCAGVREALESLCPDAGAIMARRRDLQRGSWPLGVPRSRRGCLR
jgi:hypothetical protein